MDRGPKAPFFSVYFRLQANQSRHFRFDGSKLEATMVQ